MKATQKKSIFKVALLASAVALSVSATAETFNRIATWSTTNNLPKDKALETETSPEIITASKDGKTLIYSDSPLGGIGFVSIKKPSAPKAKGFLALDGEPTSVSTAGKYVLVGVNTSESFTNPSGKLVAVHIKKQKVKTSCDLGGQPDSVAVSDDKKFVAIAIENERDEDLNDGEIPQLPAGNLVIYPLKKGLPLCDEKMVVDLTGLADIAPSDPEPEFVDFNGNNEIVVSMQENNHYAIVDAATGKVITDFSAGTTSLKNVDTEKDKSLNFTGELTDVKREPDAVKWIDNERFVAANEGDYQGGSRGFTIYSKTGKVLFESGMDLEHRVATIGHYPEKRSGKKGVEPEGIEVATYGENTYIFVLVERSGVVGVYKDTGAAPEFVQLLPSGIGPEGAIAIPKRNLLVTANEKDLIEDKGPRAHVMVYELTDSEAMYPQIQSVMVDGRPIGWGALSGLVADAEYSDILYGVNDSFYGKQPRIFTIDTSYTPARISKAMDVTRNGKPAKKLDLEGITTDGMGGFWLASEGRTDKEIPHGIYHVDANGEIIEEVSLPAELLAVEKRFASEGITRIGDTLWIAIQREWKDDPKGQVKLVSYNTKTKAWGAVAYPLESAATGWVGLSEITAYGDSVYIIERDNQLAGNAKVKRLYKVAQSDLKPVALGGKLPVVSKELVHDFIPDLEALNGFVVDKIEGFAITKDGKGFAVTDNDGVDDSTGETYFFPVGNF